MWKMPRGRRYSRSTGPTGVVNIVDDEPAAGTEWLPHFAAAIGAPAPPMAERMAAASAAPRIGRPGMNSDGNRCTRPGVQVPDGSRRRS